MIIANGTLRIVSSTDKGGYDANGLPIEVDEHLSNPIACNIKTLSHNHRGKSIDGEFTQASYEILLDAMVVPHFTAEKVKLYDNRGQAIGVFRVQDVQHLDFVGVIKLLV